MSRAVARVLARALVVVLLAAVACMAGGTIAANAASSYGPAATASIDKYQKWGTGFGCEFVGFWETTSVTSVLHVDHNCETGKLGDDYWVEYNVGDIALPGGTCVAPTIATGNIDEDENQGVVRNSVAAGTGCGEVTQLCWRYQADNGWGSVGEWSAWDCIGFAVGSPPSAEHEWYGTDMPGCVGFTPLEPWVSGARAVTVPGGWTWQITVTTDMGGYTGARFTLDGVLVKGKVGLRVSGSSVTVERGDGANTGTHPVGGGFGGWWVSTPGPQGRSVLLVRSATKTTAIGSTAADVSVTGVGFWFDNTDVGFLSATESSGTSPRAYSTRPTVTTINSTGVNSYGAHHDSQRCHFWWGSKVHNDTSGYADPAGPLAVRSEDTPPPQGSGSGTAEPPAYEPPSATDPGDDGADDGTCEGASLTDPTSWGGAMTCMIGRLLIEVVRALEALIDAVLGLADAILDGLVALFVPSEFPDFVGFSVALPDGWVAGFPNLGDPGCGPISMPSLDFGDLLPSAGGGELVDTCEAPWPLVRSVTYYGVLAVALIGMANRAVNMILDAVGMGVSLYGSIPAQDTGGRK